MSTSSSSSSSSFPHIKLCISLDDVPLQWQELKCKYLAHPELYSCALQEANWIRKSLVDGLLNHVCTYIDVSNHTTWRADGAKDLTSDYDISLSGPCKELVTIGFNECFETHFAQSSADIFDTNVYGSGPSELSREESVLNSLECLESKQKNPCPVLAQVRQFRHCTAIIENQHVWALATLLRHCTMEEREFLHAQITSTHLLRFFTQAGNICTRYPLLALDARTRNLQYASALRELVDLRHQLKDGSQIGEGESLRYMNAESQAGWYAREAYVTMGSFLHVVGNDQRGLQLVLSRDDFKDSFIENMSFVLSHFQQGNNTSFILSAKHIARAAYAATQVLGDLSEHNMTSELRDLIMEGTNIRAHREELLLQSFSSKNDSSQKVVFHMRGVSVTSSLDSVRQELLQWIVEYLMFMFL